MMKRASTIRPSMIRRVKQGMSLNILNKEAAVKEASSDDSVSSDKGVNNIKKGFKLQMVK